MPCYRAVKTDSTRGNLHNLNGHCAESESKSESILLCGYTHTHTHTHEGEQVASKEFGRVTASGGNKESCVYTAGYVLVLGGEG